jgi:hypothetical protein
MVALSINLGKEPYLGGVLELRQKKSGRIVQQVSNTGFGDAILFQLDDSLEHRRTAVLGKTAKTAFAGWFRSEPGFLELIKPSRDS